MGKKTEKMEVVTYEFLDLNTLMRIKDSGINEDSIVIQSAEKIEELETLSREELWKCGNLYIKRSSVETEAGKKMSDEEWHSYTSTIEQVLLKTYFAMYNDFVDTIAGKCVHQ